MDPYEALVYFILGIASLVPAIIGSIFYLVIRVFRRRRGRSYVTSP